MKENVSDRFWKYVKKTDNGCWLWQGSRNKKTGYGQFLLHWNKLVGSHRMAWMLTNGEIPENHCVCHHCDVRHCVNPQHLFIGTRKDNAKDKDEKGRHAKGYRLKTNIGEQHSRSKLTDSDVRQIRKLADEGTPRSQIAKRFNLSHSSTRDVILRKSWKHVT